MSAVFSVGTNSDDASTGLSLQGETVNLKSLPGKSIFIFGFRRDQAAIAGLWQEYLGNVLPDTPIYIIPVLPEKRAIGRWWIKSAMQIGTSRSDWASVVTIHAPPSAVKTTYTVDPMSQHKIAVVLWKNGSNMKTLYGRFTVKKGEEFLTSALSS